MSRHRPSGALRLLPVLAEPRDGAEQVTQALPAEPLELEEERGEWARVRTAYGYPGWVRADGLGPAPPEDWLDPRVGEAVDEARGFLGSPYLWGGMTASGIDCSGLVHMAYRRLGLLVPRDADQQEAAGHAVAEQDLRRGDLVTYGDAVTDHIAFWLGDGRILHATGRKGVNAVVEEPEPAELHARRRRLIRL